VVKQVTKECGTDIVETNGGVAEKHKNLRLTFN